MSHAKSNVTQLPPRRKLRTVTVICPAWSTEPVIMQEATVRDYMEARKQTDDQERTLFLLSRMVLDPNGNPVGMEAVLSAPLAALNQLSPHVAPLLNEEAATEDPLP